MKKAWLLSSFLFLFGPCLLAQTADRKVQKADSGAPQMAITFDDLPSHGELPPGTTRLQVAESILDTLKKEKLPPVFGFINGKHLAEDPSTMAVLEAWVNAGEPLGNHTYSHPNLNQMTPAAFETEIEQNEPILKKVAKNADWHWLRYPFLAEGGTPEKRQEIRQYLKAHAYKTADVSMSFGDYLWNSPYARCSTKHDEAAITSLHDSFLAAADQDIANSREAAHRVYGHDIPYVLLMHIGAFDAKMLPELIALYRSRGFRFITLEEAESDPVYLENWKAGNGGVLQQSAAGLKQIAIPHNNLPEKQLETMCR